MGSWQLGCAEKHHVPSASDERFYEQGCGLSCIPEAAIATSEVTPLRLLQVNPSTQTPTRFSSMQPHCPISGTCSGILEGLRLKSEGYRV